MIRRPRTLGTGLMLLVAGTVTLAAQSPNEAHREAVPVPAIDWGWEMLEVLAHAQEQSRPLFEVDHDFRFVDIVTGELNDRPQILISDLAERRPVRSLEVELVGTTLEITEP